MTFALFSPPARFYGGAAGCGNGSKALANTGNGGFRNHVEERDSKPQKLFRLVEALCQDVPDAGSMPPVSSKSLVNNSSE
jgi:hypothetical protein